MCCDIVDAAAKRAFVIVDDAAGHVVRREAVVRPDGGDDGDADFRQDVRGRAHGGQHAEDEDEHGHHHEGVGPAQGHFDDADHVLSLSATLPEAARKPGRLLINALRRRIVRRRKRAFVVVEIALQAGVDGVGDRSDARRRQMK